jgi:hypothetical protein
MLHMVKEQFTEQLEAYNRWKTDISKQIEAYRNWLEEHDMSSPEDDLRLFETIEALKTDQVTIAVAAEFSRGKTELINAIFFADYQRRLLPSSAGRTTMCPTELFYDEKADMPYIRMLPIETRLEDMSIAEYKQHPDYWTTIELDVSSTDTLVESFQEIVRTKDVAVDKAIKLGLYSEDQHKHKDAPPAHVEIPMWRHVLISFPHPMLQQGLVILDTPGLNALGSEPELTMDMLPSAQAVIFILSADTGATKSDMEIWQQHAKIYRENQQTGVLTVLNKIDTLWDELQDDSKVAANIDEQCRDTAEMLGVDRKDVYPVSAQKGLLAKIKNDVPLLERSGLMALEATLSEDIIPAKQEIVRDNIVGKIGSMVKTTKNILGERYKGNKEQLAELREMSGKNADVLMNSMKKLRAEQAVYQKDVENFQTSRQVLKRQLIALSESLSLETMDALIGKTRESMVDSWTTHGMKGGMKTFFDGAQETMVQVNWQVDKANKIVQSIYERFREEHGFTNVKPELFTTSKYSRELNQLYERADQFRNSPVTTMTEQSFVVKKFFVNMVSHARNIFFRANEDAERWAKSAMSPLGRQIKERKQQLEKRLNTMQKVKASREQLGENIQILEKECAELEQQLRTINSILDGVNAPLPGKTESGVAAVPPAGDQGSQRATA